MPSGRAAFIERMVGADEQFRRAFRDGFKRAGLSHAQLLEAMEWYATTGTDSDGQEVVSRPARSP